MTHRRRLFCITAILVAIVGMSVAADVFCLAVGSLFAGVVLAIVYAYATMAECR